MPWLQFHVSTAPDRVPTLEDALLESGALSVTLADNADQPILEPGVNETPLWDDIHLMALFDAALEPALVETVLAQVLGDTVQGRWEQVEDKDWVREWMDSYQPIRFGQRLWVVPSWREPPEPAAVNLLLDPGLAFGTGTHPSTALCLEWLDARDLARGTVVDYGCGSGILGIAALLLGADRMIGVDNDPQALIATRENVERNRLPQERCALFTPGQAPSGPLADVVLANILAGPLIQLAPRIAGLVKPGGQLALAGILEHQADEVQAAYEAEGMVFEPRAQRDEWVRLSARRP